MFEELRFENNAYNLNTQVFTYSTRKALRDFLVELYQLQIIDTKKPAVAGFFFVAEAGLEPTTFGL